jgi:hypothetical protein
MLFATWPQKKNQELQNFIVDLSAENTQLKKQLENMPALLKQAAEHEAQLEKYVPQIRISLSLQHLAHVEFSTGSRLQEGRRCRQADAGSRKCHFRSAQSVDGEDAVVE